MKKFNYFVLIFLGLVLFINGCSKTDTPSGDSVANNCKQVEEKYLEPYIEQEPYQAIEEEIVPLKYRVEGVNFYQTLRGFDVYEKGEVTIRNLDDETGTFIVEQMFTTLNDGSTTLKHAYQILPAEEITFVEDYDIDASEDVNVAYNIIPGTKTIQKVITEYRDVTKYRESIRTVEKCD